MGELIHAYYLYYTRCVVCGCSRVTVKPRKEEVRVLRESLNRGIFSFSTKIYVHSSAINELRTSQILAITLKTNC